MNANRKCIKQGAKIVVTGDDKILTAENPEKLQRHEAQRVEVTGDLNGLYCTWKVKIFLSWFYAPYISGVSFNRFAMFSNSGGPAGTGSGADPSSGSA